MPYVLKRTDGDSPQWLALVLRGDSYLPKWVPNIEDAKRFNDDENTYMWKYRYRKEFDTEVEKVPK